jgi:hypothetical protein
VVGLAFDLAGKHLIRPADADAVIAAAAPSLRFINERPFGYDDDAEQLARHIENHARGMPFDNESSVTTENTSPDDTR